MSGREPEWMLPADVQAKQYSIAAVQVSVKPAW